jgi:predicted MFS family arabinose efflux permease
MTDATAHAPANKLAAPGLSDGNIRYALWLLLAIYTLNFVDRQIVAVLGEDIKRDLSLTDTQLGLLGGLAFAVFYTVLGIPIARFAERGNRVGIISAALVVWSGFTALCGTAGNFVQILLYRFGVGVGEAGCTPPAHSLISDYVRPEKRASALALYSMGVPIGTFGGFAIGAIIAANYGWRAAFFIVGIPGIILGLLAFFTLKEPRKLGLSMPPAVKTQFGAALKELLSIPS